MTIQKDLHALQNIRPSKKLLDRISSTTGNLAPHVNGFNMPLVLFKTGIVAMVLFLVVGISTGTLIAAKASSQGSLLFPIKQALQKHNAPFFAPQITPVPLPASTSINAILPSHASASAEERSENNLKNSSGSGKEENNSSMHRESEDAEKSKQENTFFPPYFSHLHFNFFRHKD